MEKTALARETFMPSMSATPVPVDELSRPSLPLRTTGEVVDPFSEPFAKPEPDDGSVTPALGDSPPTGDQSGGDTKSSSGQRVSMYVQAFEGTSGRPSCLVASPATCEALLAYRVVAGNAHPPRILSRYA